MYAAFSTNLIFLNLITITTFGEVYKLWCSSLCTLLQPPATSTHLGLNILSTLNLGSSLSMRESFTSIQNNSKIIVLYVLVLSVERWWEDKVLNWIVASFFEFNLLLISSVMRFWFVAVVFPNSWMLPHFQRIYQHSVNCDCFLHFGGEI